MNYNGLSVTLLPLAYLKFSTNRPLAPIVATKSSWISPPLGEILTSPFSLLNMFLRITAIKSPP
jgi:hypothetical protein